jgi:hypothetical protein
MGAEKSTQQQIVSQSQLERSLEFLKAQKVTFDLKQLIAVSAVLEDYVQNGWTKELNGRVASLDKWLNEARTSKPFED